MTPTILFDGTCPFCIAQANRLRRMTRDRIAFENTYAPGVRNRFPMLPPFDANNKLGEMKFVDATGQLFGGAAAVAGALMTAGGLLGWGAHAYHLPPIRMAADWAYRQVSRRRERLSKACVDDTCGVGDQPGAKGESVEG
jgi:predicted DCC family thiol-disulfide oxidoreductase YuxK